MNPDLCEVCVDQRGQAFVLIKQPEYYEFRSLDSEEFKNWLTVQVYGLYKKPIGNEGIGIIQRMLAYKARTMRPVQLELRLNSIESDGLVEIRYDLGDEKFHSIKITRKNWSVEKLTPPMFRRYPTIQEQTMPAKPEQGDINLLDKYIKVKPPNRDDIADQVAAGMSAEDLIGMNKSEREKLLTDRIREKQKDLLLIMKVLTVYGWIPPTGFFRCEKPVLVLCGDAGAAKSTTEEIIKVLIDPSPANRLSLPKDEDRMQQQLEQNCVALYDNIKRLQQWQSDMICQASTGGGGQKKKLYTDSGVVIYNYTRMCLLNGIEAVATNPDIVSRSIIMELEKIREYKDADVFWKEFNQDKPKILAGILNTLVKTLDIYEEKTLNLKGLERLGTFEKIGYVIAEAMDGQGDRFRKTYKEILQEQNKIVVDNNPVADAIITLMRQPEYETTPWEGSVQDLMDSLEDMLPRMGYKTLIDKNGNATNTKPRAGWPADAAKLGKLINKLKTTLEKEGILIERRRKRQNNYIKISKINVQPILTTI